MLPHQRCVANVANTLVDIIPHSCTFKVKIINKDFVCLSFKSVSSLAVPVPVRLVEKLLFFAQLYRP